MGRHEAALDQAPSRRTPAADRGLRRRDAAAPEAALGGSVLLALFLISLLIPVRLYVADQLINPNRLFLLIAFIPLFFGLISLKAGPIQPIDLFMAGFCAWIALSLYINHGSAQIPYIGITIVEMMGGYMVGRILVRNDRDYRAFFRYFAWGLIFLLPFVLYEQATRRLPISEILGKAFITFPYVDFPQRMGMNRIQAVFEHPILYGLFCSVAIGNFYFLYRDRPGRRLPLVGLASFMTFLSLSSGAVLAMMIQLGLIVWERVTQARWKLLVVLTAIAYVVVDMLSNRTPVQVFISYATFNQSTAYNRVLIWRYGMENVRANPVFGIGLNDWVRPWWMSSSGSFDNFWLLQAMSYGVPAFLLLAMGIALSLWRIQRRQGLSFAEAQCRTGYLVSAAGLFFTLSTVDVWGPTAVLFVFFLGAGVWMAEAGGAEVEGGEKSDSPSRSASRQLRDPRGEAEGAPAPPAAGGKRKTRLPRRTPPFSRSR